MSDYLLQKNHKLSLKEIKEISEISKFGARSLKKSVQKKIAEKFKNKKALEVK